MLLLDTVRADEKYSSITCTRDTTATSGNTRNRFNGGDDIVSCCLGFFFGKLWIEIERLAYTLWQYIIDWPEIGIRITFRAYLICQSETENWFQNRNWFRLKPVSDLAVLCVWFANLKLVSQNHRNLLGRWFRHPNQIWNCSCLCWLPWVKLQLKSIICLLCDKIILHTFNEVISHNSEREIFWCGKIVVLLIQPCSCWQYITVGMVLCIWLSQQSLNLKPVSVSKDRIGSYLLGFLLDLLLSDVFCL